MFRSPLRTIARRVRTSACSLVAASALLLSARPAFAGGSTLYAELAEGAKLRIDGLLNEWGGEYTDFDQHLKGSASSESLRVSSKVAYDEKNLYVALHIKDDKLARGSTPGPDDDHATLHLAFPVRGGGFRTHSVDLYAGMAGKSAGAVLEHGHPVSGAKLVEAPNEGGLTVEVQLPWSAFPEAATTRVGLRGALTYTDASAPGHVRAVVGTSDASEGGALPPLMLAGEQGLDRELIRGKGLTRSAKFVRYGNVSGDRMLERVAVNGTYLSVVGPHYRGGTEFYFAELDVSDPSQVRRLDLADFDGDGRDEILISKRIGGSDRYREMVQVMKFGDDDAPFVAFQREVAIKTPEGEIANKVSIKPGNPPSIEIAQGDAEGFDPGTYAEPTPGGGVESALLPWQTIKSQRYAWKGRAFEKVGEDTWTPKAASGDKKHSKKSHEAGPPPPPPPRPPTADELLDRVYALYRKDRGVGKSAPRFDFVTDVAGDSTTERVLIHDKDIVVFGKGFREGTSYSFITVGVADPKDIVDVTARDLTGDGKADIIVRAVLHAKASKELGGDTVERYALFVYKVIGDKLTRIFAAETGRALGDNRVIGALAFSPAPRGGLSIDLKPGRAVGWTEKTYPFPVDAAPAGGLEPLILPWGSSGRHYTFSGSAYVQQ